MLFLKSKILNHKSLFIISLLFLSIGERIMFDLGPNIELVTISMLLAAAYLGEKESLWIVLITMILSDLILGNTNIFLFTWSGFLIPALYTSIYLNKSKQSSIKLTGRSTLFGLGTGVFFFLWTNLGVWLLDTWGMYSNDLKGLMQSYINALPFLKIQVLSNLVIVPLGFTLVECLKYLIKIISKSKNICHPELDSGSI
ncbi:hypothetical protein JXA63_05820 [Candidatus Woesebacteria bacterium]|nr:hypothetical protein [Candidatus Woesebacteria bacterium]